jgi:hypothetical protein
MNYINIDDNVNEIKKVKYYDELGEEQYKIVSEEYIPDTTLGEEVTSLWVNEWWEGVKIGKDIYLNIKPRKVQYNKIHNPSFCHPGIIGEIYNTNQAKAVSLVDRCKNYQYMYDVIWDRLNKAISTNYGKIFELDLSKVPENWEIEKWLHRKYFSKKTLEKHEWFTLSDEQVFSFTDDCKKAEEQISFLKQHNPFF